MAVAELEQQFDRSHRSVNQPEPPAQPGSRPPSSHKRPRQEGAPAAAQLAALRAAQMASLPGVQVAALRGPQVAALPNVLPPSGLQAVHGELDGPYVRLLVRDQRGHLEKLKMRRTEELEDLFATYCENVGVQRSDIFFTFNGQRISGSAEPGELGMADFDVIEVHTRQEVN